jgi:CRP-like cAMP-binding protein
MSIGFEEPGNKSNTALIMFSVSATNNMPEHDTLASVDVTGSLNGSAQSSDLDELSLSAFDAGLKHIFLPGGQILFRENELADSLYIVISGCLGVIVRANDGHDVSVARIPAGETVGEMSFLDDCVRSATVEALRDTELLKFNKASYEDRLLQDSSSMHAIISLLVRRLRKTTHANNGTILPIRTVAVVPLGFDVDHLESPTIFINKFPATVSARPCSTARWQSAQLLGFMLQKPGTTSLCTTPNPPLDSGRIFVFVKLIESCSLHQRPRRSQHHRGSPVKFNRFAGPLILYCFTFPASEPTSKESTMSSGSRAERT